jgi:hypothetical protein
MKCLWWFAVEYIHGKKVGKGKEQGKRDAAISMVSKAKHAYVMCNETIE